MTLWNITKLSNIFIFKPKFNYETHTRLSSTNLSIHLSSKCSGEEKRNDNMTASVLETSTQSAQSVENDILKIMTLQVSGLCWTNKVTGMDFWKFSFVKFGREMICSSPWHPGQVTLASRIFRFLSPPLSLCGNLRCGPLPPTGWHYDVS